MDPRERHAEAVRLHQAGRLAAAEEGYRQVLAVAPRHAESLRLLGVLAQQTGRHALALRLLDEAIAIDSENALAHTNLGSVLAQLGRWDAAIASHRQAVALRPDFPGAHVNLGNAQRALGALDAAVASYRRALALAPDDPDTLNNLGGALTDRRRLAEAEACYRQAAALRPDARLHSNLSNVLREQGKLAEAAAAARTALAVQPDHAEAHYALAMALLPQGAMPAGWQEYEWRWLTRGNGFLRRGFGTPQWRGEAAAGRTILLHAEQGFGDTLQFCRYVALVAARGLRVVLEVQPTLERLLRGLPGATKVLARGAALPAFTLHCPLLSLPLALGTTLATIPHATAYLRPDPAEAAAWRGRLAALPPGRRVGLVWAGNPRAAAPAAAAIDRRRSIDPLLLVPLLAVPGVQFVCLQKDGPAPPFALPDPMPAMRDFADTAALVANLDLVIAVDTAVAHLAAALGRPVWLLDRFDHCWRWLAGRRDSPWYPTLRIYRQPAPGAWGPVIAEVARDLAG